MTVDRLISELKHCPGNARVVDLGGQEITMITLSEPSHNGFTGAGVVTLYSPTVVQAGSRGHSHTLPDPKEFPEAQSSFPKGEE